ncbi:melanoma-associated antigen 10-like [Tamandua tetradactyla]|uniref:melanoma-associated antigen 10-like n=1 Tax=Tamandua tetradactyla TaxID=48850 RepID=UPI0040544208
MMLEEYLSTVKPSDETAASNYTLIEALLEAIKQRTHESYTRTPHSWKLEGRRLDQRPDGIQCQQQGFSPSFRFLTSPARALITAGVATDLGQFLESDPWEHRPSNWPLGPHRLPSCSFFCLPPLRRVIMLHVPKHQCQKPEEDLQSQSNTEEVSAVGAPSTPRSPQRACFSPGALAATPLRQSDEDCSRPEEEGPSTSQAVPDTESLLGDAIDDTVANLVKFGVFKYQKKEPITRAEMLNIVNNNCEDHFPAIFRRASKCLRLVFGIDVKEVDPTSQSYVLVSTLGLTYDRMRSGYRKMPRTGLLVTILGVIFMEGSRAPEQKIWESLNMMGVYAGKKHFIYGEPKKLLTRNWVRAKYLQYRRVPGSDPVHYEFLWGPRAHAETSKMKVLELLANINNTVPTAFPTWYEEALRDEEERAQPRIATISDTAARTRVYLRASSSSFTTPSEV